MIVVGHRGVAGHFPENSKASILAAIELGLEWVEVDIQPTFDNVLVVCHDHTVDRCSNGSGRIDELTLKQLKELDFGRWFDTEFTGQSIMTMEELLQLAQENNLKLNLEVKIDRHDAQAVCELVKQTLDKAEINKDNILLSSFSADVIRHLHQLLPDYRLGVLSERLTGKVKALLREVDAFSCNLNHLWTNKKHVATLQAEGYQVWCYTVNNPRRLKHLSNLDAIFSDFPARFLP